MLPIIILSLYFDSFFPTTVMLEVLFLDPLHMEDS